MDANVSVAATATNKKKMTLGQASATIAGCGVGAGVLAMPYFINKIGVIMAFVIICISFLITFGINLLVAQLALKNGGKGTVLDIIRNIVLKGKIKKVGSIVLFILLTFQMIMSMGSYINGASDILNDIFGFTSGFMSYFTKFIFFIFASILVFFSLKVLGIVEQIGVYVLYLTLGALIVGSCFNITNSLPTNISSFKDNLCFFSTTMLAFNCFHSVPQVVEGLEGDKVKIKKSVFYGLLLNVAIILLIAIFSLLSCKEVTKNVVIGWSSGIGSWAKIVAGVFTLMAFLTSFWSYIFAVRDMIVKQLNIKPKIALIFATIPPLIISLLPIGNFSSFLGISSALIALVLAVFIVPGYMFDKKNNKTIDYDIPGLFGKTPVCVAIFLFYIVMAVGSVISAVGA